MASVAVMDVAGYLMGPYSAWTSFLAFEKLFFAPWLPMAGSIYLLAGRGTVRLHRLSANVLVKACIATPLARLAGRCVVTESGAGPGQRHWRRRA